MRISVTIFVILISTFIVNASVLDPVIENVVHLKASNPPSGVAGIWKKKTIWKPRWVKEWKSAKVMKPVWKKVWSPVQIREWVPIPKPPPGWDSISTPLSLVHSKGPNSQVKDSTGHDSRTVHTATKIPLWDPVPYPESQQPPPPQHFPQHSHDADPSCGKHDCDNSHSATTFNHQQISEILGPRYSTPEHLQNEYSETVNHLTRLPPNAPSPVAQDFHTNNHFNSFPALSEFLVPPTFPPGNEFRQQLNNFRPLPPTQSATQTPNSIRHFPPQVKGHFITKDQPYKFEFPQTLQQNTKNNTQHDSERTKFHTQNNSTSFRPHTNNDFIQAAELVGEYHYSEFDLHNIKRPQQEKSEQIKPQQTVKPDIQKPTNHQQQKHNRTETVRPQSQHVQKKHISFFSFNSDNNIQQQRPILQEIFPKRKPQNTQNHKLIPLNDVKHPSSPILIEESNLSPTSDGNQQQKTAKIESIIPSVHRFSQPIDLSTTSIRQQQKENYPVYKIPQNKTNASIQQPKENSPNNKIPPENLLLPTASNHTIQGSVQQKKNYPQFQFPQIPHNHRFSAPSSSNSILLNGNSSQQQNENQINKFPPIQKFLFPTAPTIVTANDSIQQPHNHRFSPPFLLFNTHSANRTLGEEKENYPVYTPLPEFKFLPPVEKLQPDRTTKLQPVLNATQSEKNTSLELVFATTPDEPAKELQNLQKTTTTEPYSVIFSSSLLSTTESATRSPVIVVTPVSQSSSAHSGPNQIF